MTDPNRCHIGDAREVLAAMAAEGVKVQICVTSPPYWGLRDYGVEGQIGLEPTPEAYVKTMVEVFRLVREVLAEDGTLWLNLGDSYASGSHKGGSTSDEFFSGSGHRGGCASWSTRDCYKASTLSPGLKVKDLIGIPWRLALALQADGWYLRSDIIWHKPNPMPESVTDRPAKAHEYLFLLSKNAKYYYDAEAVREVPDKWYGDKPKEYKGKAFNWTKEAGGIRTKDKWSNPNGRNRRSVWTIATEPYSEAHFATFPRKLVEPCVLAGTSQRGHCPGCGGRWERVVEQIGTRACHGMNHATGPEIETPQGRRRGLGKTSVFHTAQLPVTNTTGWHPPCACALDPVPDIVLDPFFGSGTVGQVAQHLGRHWLGIDLNPHYAAMQGKRTAQCAMVLA